MCRNKTTLNVFGIPFDVGKSCENTRTLRRGSKIVGTIRRASSNYPWSVAEPRRGPTSCSMTEAIVRCVGTPVEANIFPDFPGGNPMILRLSGVHVVAEAEPGSKAFIAMRVDFNTTKATGSSQKSTPCSARMLTTDGHKFYDRVGKRVKFANENQMLAKLRKSCNWRTQE